jgi:hypothetical protein
MIDDYTYILNNHSIEEGKGSKGGFYCECDG